MYQFWKGVLTVGDLKARDITFLRCALFNMRMDYSYQFFILDIIFVSNEVF